MMATGSDTEKPEIGERYATAVGTSNLRVAEHGSAVAEIIAAAGMNKHRTGLALRRLLAEWDRSAKPHEKTPEEVQELAASLKTEGAEFRVAVRMTEDQIKEAVEKHHLDPRTCVFVAEVRLPNPNAGKVREERDGRVRFRLPLAVAADMARDWHQHELLLLLQRLKTLPSVRDALIFKAREERWEGDVHLVGQVLLWWLDSRCEFCHGRRNKVIPGTGRTGSKPCGECKGTGMKNPPYGWAGGKMLAYMLGCLTSAAQDLSEGTFKHHRSKKNQTARELEELRTSGKPIQKLPPKIPPRRYSPEGKFYDGEYVTRAGQGDVHRVLDMDKDGYTATFECVVAPSEGWCKVGDREPNLCRRYSKVEYDPKKET
jgi:hypothetical protein